MFNLVPIKFPKNGPPVTKKELKMAISGHKSLKMVPAASNGLNIGWTRLNIVFHIRGGLLEPFCPQKNGPRVPQKAPKMPNFDPKLPYLAISGSSCQEVVSSAAGVQQGDSRSRI